MKSPWYFNRYILLVLAIFFCVVSFYFSLTSFNNDLFSSSGAVITVAGLFLNIKHTLAFHLDIPLINKFNLKKSAFSFASKFLSEEQEIWINNALSDEKYGVLFMIIGTLIWAYGAYFVEWLKI